MGGNIQEPAKAEGGQSLRVFLSYSRKDGVFIAKLAEALIGLGYEASYDASPHGRHNPDLAISAEDEWWKALEGMIAKADVMVFVVSRASAESKVCDEEIAYARRLGKRVIAILREEIDFRTVPPKLAALNVKLRFTDNAEAAFAASLAELKQALDLDAGWWREQKWFAVQLKDWLDAEERARPGWLLSAAETERAEIWSARRPPGAQRMSEEERGFLAASRENVVRQARNRRRMQGAVWALTAAAMLITIAGAWFVAQGQRSLARQTSAALASAAAVEFDAGQYDRALRLAILAGRETWLTPVASEAAFEIGRAAEFTRAVLRLGPESNAFCRTLSSDGRALLTYQTDGLAILEEGEDGAWTRSLLSRSNVARAIEQQAAQSKPFCGAFSADGKLVAGPGEGDELLMWRRGEDGWESQLLEGGEAGQLWGVAFAGNTTLIAWRADGVSLWRDWRWDASRREYLARPPRERDPAVPQPGSPYGGAVNPTVAVIEARASDSGDVVLTYFSDVAGNAVQVWTRDFLGAWTSQLLPDTPRYIGSIDLGREGKRALVVGDQHARVYEADSAGKWRVIVDDGQDSRVSVVGESNGVPVAAFNFDKPPDTRDPISAAKLVSEYGDADAIAVAGDGYAALKRIVTGDGAGRLEKLARVDLPRGEIAAIGALPNMGGGYVTLSDRVLAIGSGWRSLAGEVVHEGKGFSANASADGRTVAVGGTDGSMLLWRIGRAPLGLVESPNRVARAKEFKDPGFYSPTSATSARFGRSADEVLAVEQEADEEVIALYTRDAKGGWARAEVVRETFSVGRAMMSSKGEIVAGSGGEVAVFAPAAGGKWAKRVLPGKNWLGAGGIWSADGSELVTVLEDSTFATWREGAEGAWTRSGVGGSKGDAVKAVFLGGTGEIASLGNHGLMIWRRGSGGAWNCVLVDGAVRTVYDQMVVSADGVRIAGGGVDGVRVWTRRKDGAWTSTAVSPRTARTSIDDSLSLSADGQLMVTSKLGDSYDPGGSKASIWYERTGAQWTAVPVPSPGALQFAVDISPDGRRMLAMDWEGALLADIEWLTGGPGVTGERSLSRLVELACQQKLPGGQGNLLPVISRADVEAAPILRGREGEDVCDWRPAWYDGALGAMFGWLG
jgi:hypothetical protein